MTGSQWVEKNPDWGYGRIHANLKAKPQRPMKVLGQPPDVCATLRDLPWYG
jgi:hypothetical protein